MGRAPRTAFVAALSASCLFATGNVPPAGAAPIVTLLSGLLTVSVVPPTAALSTTGSTVSGALGTTTIIDGRLAASGYDVSVSTNGFDLVGATSSTSQTHIPASSVAVTNTGASGGTSNRTTAVALPSATPIFHLSYPSSVLALNLVSTYTLSMTLTIPAAAAAGLYTGTVTQTVA